MSNSLQSTKVISFRGGIFGIASDEKNQCVATKIACCADSASAVAKTLMRKSIRMSYCLRNSLGATESAIFKKGYCILAVHAV